jgi:glutamine synthetase
MLAAGRAGIDEDLDCGEPYVGNAYVDAKLPALPGTLAQAAGLLQHSRIARERLGDAVVDFYVHTARLEVQAFDSAVTNWERTRYFEQI